IERGAVLAPGEGIGTLYVAGDLRLSPGATYRVETEAYGPSDLTVASGEVHMDGAALEIEAIGTRRYRPINFYRLFETGAGVSGMFASITTNASYLDPS